MHLTGPHNLLSLTSSPDTASWMFSTIDVTDTPLIHATLVRVHHDPIPDPSLPCWEWVDSDAL